MARAESDVLPPELGCGLCAASEGACRCEYPAKGAAPPRALLEKRAPAPADAGDGEPPAAASASLAAFAEFWGRRNGTREYWRWDAVGVWRFVSAYPALRPLGERLLALPAHELDGLSLELAADADAPALPDAAAELALRRHLLALQHLPYV